MRRKGCGAGGITECAGLGGGERGGEYRVGGLAAIRGGSRHGLMVRAARALPYWWVVACANLPTFRLSGFSTCREVGKLGSWRARAVVGVGAGGRSQARKHGAGAGRFTRV